MMNEIIIRKAFVDDFERIMVLFKEFAQFQQTPELLFITLDELIASKDFFECFVAETAQKEIVGYTIFCFAYYSWSGKAIYLDDLFVTQAWRKFGLGNLLFEKVIEFAKEHNCVKLKWRVSKWNENAIAFYKRKGAVIDEIDFNCDLYLNPFNHS